METPKTNQITERESDTETGMETFVRLASEKYERFKAIAETADSGERVARHLDHMCTAAGSVLVQLAERYVQESDVPKWFPNFMSYAVLTIKTEVLAQISKDVDTMEKLPTMEAVCETYLEYAKNAREAYTEVFGREFE